MEEIQDGDEAPGQQVHLVQRPVVLLAVADVALPLRPLQSAAPHFGRYLPAEVLALGHARHHRPDQLARPLTLPPAAAPSLLGRFLPLARPSRLPGPARL